MKQIHDGERNIFLTLLVGDAPHEKNVRVGYYFLSNASGNGKQAESADNKGFDLPSHINNPHRACNIAVVGIIFRGVGRSEVWQWEVSCQTKVKRLSKNSVLTDAL
jgi:hypothetical protein